MLGRELLRTAVDAVEATLTEAAMVPAPSELIARAAELLRPLAITSRT